MIPLRRTPACQLDESEHQRSADCRKTIFKQIERAVFLVHVTGGSVVRIEMRKTGVLRRISISQISSNAHTDQDRCRNKERPPRLRRSSGRPGRKSRAANVPLRSWALGALSLRHVDDRLAPIEREINAERNQRSENRAEDTAFAHMKPVCLHLDDRDRAVALKIHVERVGRPKRSEQPHVQSVRQDQPGDRHRARYSPPPPRARR